MESRQRYEKYWGTVSTTMSIRINIVYTGNNFTVKELLEMVTILKVDFPDTTEDKIDIYKGRDTDNWYIACWVDRNVPKEYSRLSMLPA